jgi:hypothetical protein
MRDRVIISTDLNSYWCRLYSGHKKYVFLSGENEMRHTFFAHHTFCADTSYDTAERWLTDDFSQNIFPITHLKIVRLVGVQEPFQNLFLKSAEKSSPPILNSWQNFEESKKKFF